MDPWISRVSQGGTSTSGPWSAAALSFPFWLRGLVSDRKMNKIQTLGNFFWANQQIIGAFSHLTLNLPIGGESEDLMMILLSLKFETCCVWISKHVKGTFSARAFLLWWNS